MNPAVLLAAIALHVPVPANVNVQVAHCPDLPAKEVVSCANFNGNIWLDPRDGNPRLTLAHEVGHVWWFNNMNNADVLNYKRTINSSAPIYGDSADMVPVAEQFADTYAICSMSIKARQRWRKYSEMITDTPGVYLGTGYGEIVKRQYVAQTCWLIKNKESNR